MVVQICVGSSCYLKGSHEIAEYFQKEIEENALDAEISLAGCFCTGKCNRVGVTIVIDDVIHTGVTPENFKEFFRENILSKVKGE